MLNISDLADKKIYVKGFAQDINFNTMVDPKECSGEFVAIITDLFTSGLIKVTSATETADGKWEIVCANGEHHVLDKEPAMPRIMLHGKLVTNFSRTLFGNTFDEVLPEEYQQAAEAIEKGERKYLLVGYVGRSEVNTSNLVKFWIDDTGKYHGLTRSGSHYIINS